MIPAPEALMRLDPEALAVTSFSTDSEITDTLPPGHPTPATGCGWCPPSDVQQTDTP